MKNMKAKLAALAEMTERGMGNGTHVMPDGTVMKDSEHMSECPNCGYKLDEYSDKDDDTEDED